MTDETVVIDGRCVHGKEIRTIVWGRPLGDSWQIHGQPKCKKCPDLILLKTTSQKPTAVQTTRGRRLTLAIRVEAGGGLEG